MNTAEQCRPTLPSMHAHASVAVQCSASSSLVMIRRLPAGLAVDVALSNSSSLFDAPVGTSTTRPDGVVSTQSSTLASTGNPAVALGPEVQHMQAIERAACKRERRQGADKAGHCGLTEAGTH